MDLKNVIEQRKTIKAFNSMAKISRTELEEMLSLSQLAPSKANLQPWRFVVVDDESIKQTLSTKVAFNGPPCETAAAVIAVLADLEYEKLLGDILDRAIETGCLHSEFRDRQFNFLLNLHNQATASDIRDQVLIDSSLASMQFMLIAKDRGYDTHAIGVFDRESVMRLLEIDEKRYLPVMLLAIGKAANPALPSCRLPLEYTVSWNNGKGFKK
ncbi:nitroreductase family protein [Mannheimia varigena]|uniref:nitroreductase family protein n=1 Tax=Mannheimia varigena TaxID=85404 RepID=UPI0003E3E39B|nr:nitroreductase family protein [Mannheimia varigena]AHG77273.1 Nitroreductase [Mannheimia varigena USDA-ARS-USMARC-1312]AHG80067.1 Nitroreductase [Mannheimia varigena USDA-ARS-USMARC-1388]MDY2948072.1 nitroreductase family protein [Mannheimia varigena]QLD33435.1 nitroreductase family protein [Mannheimia varigena]